MEVRENPLYPTHLLCAYVITPSTSPRDARGRLTSMRQPMAAGANIAL